MSAPGGQLPVDTATAVGVIGREKGNAFVPAGPRAAPARVMPYAPPGLR